MPLTSSRLTESSYVTSTKVPPLKSRPRLRPLKDKESTETTNKIIENIQLSFYSS